MSTTKQELAHEQATQSATDLRDAVYAIQGLVAHPWNGIEADRARNAIDWIANTMSGECDQLDMAVEDLRPKGGAA